MEFKDIITSIAAVIGMLLGIYNFVRARAADRVRLQVIPKASSFQGSDHAGREFYIYSRDAYDLNHPTAPPDTLSLEVINLSKFAVIVNEVGLKRSWSRRRAAMITPILRDGNPWPRKLESRESVIVHFDATRLLDLESIGSVKQAYASTVCGTTCYGSSGALHDFIRIVKATG